jgi:hypothetical protein
MYTYLYIYTYIYVYVYVYIYIYIYMYVCMYVCVFINAYICTQIFLHMCLYVCMYVYICIYIYVYVYIYIHIYHIYAALILKRVLTVRQKWNNDIYQKKMITLFFQPNRTYTYISYIYHIHIYIYICIYLCIYIIYTPLNFLYSFIGKGESMTFIKKLQPVTNETEYTKRVMKIIEYYPHEKNYVMMGKK